MSENQTPQNSAPAGGGDGPPPIEQRIATMMNHPAYMDATHAEHAGVVNQVQLLHLEQDRQERGEPEPEKKADDSFDAVTPEMVANLPPTSELARQVGVDIPDLPQGIEYVDSAMADFLGWCLDEGLNKAQAQSILTDYSQWLVIAGRSVTGERPGDAEEWMTRLKGHGLSEAQARRLVMAPGEHEAAVDPLHQRRRRGP